MPDAHYALAACMFVGAVLYTSVGHGGASSYIALMALFSIPAVVMRPTALALNIIVAALGAWRYASAGYFRWRAIWPFMAGAMPFAFVGGGIQLPGHLYRPMVGVVLVFAGLVLLWRKEIRSARIIHDPPIWLGAVVGAGIGLLAGLTGTGGGIFLSPIIIFLGWSDIRTASGCAAVFILGNSIAGLAGNLAAVQSLPPDLPVYIAAVVLGTAVGTTFGTRLPIIYIQRALGIVLLIAGAKLIGT